MSQHDYVIDNQTFPATRTDLNNALAAIVSQNAGATAPSTTYAYQLWYDTTADKLKMRNADDDAWIDLFDVNQTTDVAEPTNLGSIDLNGTELILDADGDTSITADTDDQIDFKTGGSDRMVIDSSGNVGIGTTSPNDKLDISGGVRVTSYTPNADVTGGLFDYLNGQGRLFAYKSVGGSDLLFYTNPSGGSVAERMRVDSSGRVKIATTSTVSTATAEQFAVDAGTSGGYGGVFASNTSGGFACTYFKAGTNVANLALFYKNTTSVGSITTNGSTTSYNTSSDYRLKENVTDITGATDRLKQLNPVRFNFISDADTTVDGFLAHEVQTVVPEAITGTHNQVQVWTQEQIDAGEAPDNTSAGDNKLDDDGNTIPVYQGIDQSKLVPLLVATIQELEARIAALEAN